MALKIGIGLSTQNQNAYAAGTEAAKQALEKAGLEKADFAVLMASSLYSQEDLLKGVREALGGTPLIGCTTAGTITDYGLHEQSVAVLVLQSDKLSFHPIKVEGLSENIRAGGEKFADAVKNAPGGNAKVAFIFSDALAGNGTELVRGVLGTLGANFPLMGGAAADDMNFKKTSQYYNDEVLGNAAVGFAISGDVIYAVGADHGWQPVGNPRTVTKAKGTTLYELDGKPAFAIYEDYFGDRAGDFKKTLSLAAVSYPLGMKVADMDAYMIRVPLAVQDDGSIVCGAEVIEGSSISLMIGTIESALSAAEATTERLSVETKEAQPRVAFVSDCVARKILFGERREEEFQAVKNMMGEAGHIFGFYSYGQIAPLGVKDTSVNTCDPGFYEQSISLAIIGE
ncbi:FIST C-terminal domain-containing protein [Candidatus Kaiserbacteria bacterium]|nr:FIST C-terminal domain-containing protein [Candidatus Kaiserbacteria bacterium]